MTRIVAFLSLLACSVVANAQCPSDTLVDGGMPHGEFQWSGGGNAVWIECPTCVQFDRAWSWQLLDTGNVLTIHGNFFPPCDTVLLLFTRNCHLVVADTCMVLPVTGSGCEYTVMHDPMPPSELIVMWRSAFTDSVGVLGTSYTDGFPSSTILYDLDTCGTATGYDDNFPTQLPTSYYRLDTGREAHVPLSPGLHIELSVDSRRLIMVR